MGDDRATDRRIMANYALICGGPGAIGSFSALWLQAQGCSPLQASHTIGWMMSMTLIFNLVVGIGAQNARYVAPVCRTLCLVCVMGGAAMLLATSSHWRIAGWMLASMAIGASVPLIDAASMARDLPRTARFYVRRGAASAAYLCGSLALGFAASRFGIGDTMAVWLLGFSTLATFCLARLVVPQSPLRDVLHAAGTHRRSFFTRTRKGADSPQTPPTLPLHVLGTAALIIIAATLIEASHGINALSMLHWSSRGYTPGLCSILWQVGECSDVALLWLLSRRPIDPTRVLALGGIAAAIRWAGFAMAPPIGAIFALQVLHALSSTGTYVAAVQLLDRMMPERWRAVCQLLAWAVLLYLSKAVVMLSSGTLYAAPAMSSFWLMSLLALCGTLCAIGVGIRMGTSLSFKFHST